MITGDLIRLKNMVDDCVRVARSIQRESERLTAEERTQLVEHIRSTAPQFKEVLAVNQSSPSETGKQG